MREADLIKVSRENLVGLSILTGRLLKGFEPAVTVVAEQILKLSQEIEGDLRKGSHAKRTIANLQGLGKLLNQITAAGTALQAQTRLLGGMPQTISASHNHNTSDRPAQPTDAVAVASEIIKQLGAQRRGAVLEAQVVPYQGEEGGDAD
jgi:hypothetical protein